MNLEFSARAWAHILCLFAASLTVGVIAHAQPVPTAGGLLPAPPATVVPAVSAVAPATPQPQSTEIGQTTSRSAQAEFLDRTRSLTALSRSLGEACKMRHSKRELIASLDEEKRNSTEKLAQLNALLRKAKANKSSAAPETEAEIERVEKRLNDLNDWATLSRLADMVDGLGGLCRAFCDPAAEAVNICGFSATQTAAAAVIADWDTVRLVAKYVSNTLHGGPNASDGTAIQLKDLPGWYSVGSLAGKADNSSFTKTALGPDLGAVSMRTAEVGLAALAKVIEDRAKREGILALLEQVGHTMCGLPKDGKPRLLNASDKVEVIEIRTHWFPNTCGLASRSADFMQYGGGNQLVRALQGAMTSDVKDWPAQAAGLGVSSAFFADACSSVTGNAACSAQTVIECQGADSRQQPICSAALKLRSETVVLARELMSGANAASALAKYGASVTRLNVRKATAGEDAALLSRGAQVAACAVSLPSVALPYGTAVDGLEVPNEDKVEALMLGALAGTPACFTIIGEGWEPGACAGLRAGSGDLSSCWQQKSPIDYPDIRLEKLNTVLRWSEQVHIPARRVAGEWSDLESAFRNYGAAIGNYRTSPSRQIPMPSLNVGAVNDSKTFAEAMRALEAFVQNTARTAQQSDQVKVLQAASALTHATVDFGAAAADLGSRLSMHSLYPGLCRGIECNAAVVGNHLDKGRTALERLSTNLNVVDAALTQDWGQAVPRLLSAMRRQGLEACKQKTECNKVIESLSRYSGLFVAVASDSDPNHVAEALDAAATPIGGWRRKHVKDTTTISIASFPGFGSAAELRYGQYGVQRERFNKAYPVNPTLFMPVGVDFAFGGVASNLFLPLLDPAAFLQYDSSEGGRLPGARITTAFSPGVAWRIAVPETPVSFVAFAVYRPGLRAWDSSVSGPAADAVQLGGLLSIDVTLFNLYTRDPD